MTRKMKLKVMLIPFLVGTPLVVVASISLALSGLEYGIIYPIGVISSSLVTLVLFWITAVPEITFYIVKQTSPHGSEAKEYRSYGTVLIAILLFAISLALYGFVREGIAQRDGKLSGYLVLCIGNFLAGLWLVLYCTFRSGWVAKITYSRTGMTCRHGPSYFELVELRYILDRRNAWMPVVRIGGLWRPIGEEGSQPSKIFEYKVSRSAFPKLDVDHFVETMTRLFSAGVEHGKVLAKRPGDGLALRKR